MLDLASVNAKIDWCQVHAHAVEEEIQSWFDRKPYSFVYQCNDDCTIHSIVLKISETPCLDRWALMIGDAIHNLRCALDHLVYAIAVHESGQNPPDRWDKLQFPIYDIAAKFAENSGRMIGSLSAGIQAEIESFQPYNRPHKDLPPLLGLLRDFDNTDKHRLLNLVKSNIVQGEFGLRRKGGGNFAPPLQQFFIRSSEVEDGTEISRLVFGSSTPDMEMDRSNFRIHIALKHERSAAGYTHSSFDTILRDLTLEVREAVRVISSKVK